MALAKAWGHTDRFSTSHKARFWSPGSSHPSLPARKHPIRLAVAENPQCPAPGGLSTTVQACPCLSYGLSPGWGGPGYLLQLPLLVLPEGKMQQLVVPGHLQVHILMGESGVSWAEGCPSASGHSEP